MEAPVSHTQTQSSTPAPRSSVRVVLVARGQAEPDRHLVAHLERELTARAHRVFVDRSSAFGLDWAKDIEKQIRTADAVVALISQSALQSEMMHYEIEIAQEASQRQEGRPRLIPVRLGEIAGTTDALNTLLEGPTTLVYGSAADVAPLTANLLGQLDKIAADSLVPPPPPTPTPGPLRLTVRPAGKPRVTVLSSATSPAAAPVQAGRPLQLEAPGGAVPLDSEFYVMRPPDSELRNALIRGDSIILIKGARQMGKTSLLARGLQQARERGAKIVLTDFQKFNTSHLESPDALYFTLAESIAEQLSLDALPQDNWDERRGANVNFERYLRRSVLAKMNAPLVWGLDEVDRLFTCPFGSEVFGLFRSWHNERALDPSGPWAGLTLAIAYATEAFLFITDMNQSPFNVGTRLALDDFNVQQVEDLNRRYGSPLKDTEQIARFFRLLNGQPYLVRRGLHEMVEHHLTLEQLETMADRDEGIYGDHLRRILISLAKDQALCDELREILRLQPCPTPDAFYRLRSAGIITGNSQQDCKLRCQIYATYLARHLL